MNQHGSFKTSENGLLQFEDFIQIYNVIEGIGRFELQSLRESNEKERTLLFNQIFVNNDKS